MAMHLDEPFDAEAIQEGPLDRAARRAVRREVDGWCAYRNMAMRLTGPGHGVDNPGGGGGSGDTLLGIATVTEASGAAKTNEPFSIIWPMGPDDEFTVSDHIKIYDDDGAGGQGSELANYQAVNLSTDANADGRAIHISGIIPSIGSGATRKLRVYKTADTEPSGTAITEADLFATTWRIVHTFDIGGTSYVADSNDCEGASGTFSKTAACFHGTYVTGPAETCRVYSLPPSNTGTAHESGDGLRVWLHVYMRKAGTGAVDGGNPITHVKTRCVLRNMDVARASPANYLYGLTVQRPTSLSDATLISTDYTDHDGNVTRYSFARSQPAVTLTPDFSTITAWRNSSGDNVDNTATYVSSTQFTISGNVTSAYHVGRPVRLVGTTTGTIYGNITASSYSAPNTTVTVSWVSGSLSSEALTSRVAGTGSFMSFDRASGSFATDILGAPIVTADMSLMVVERTSATRVKTLCISDTHPVSTTTNYTSGNWTIEGCGHEYGRKWDFEVNVGTQPTSVAIWGDHNSADTSDSKAALDFLISKKWLLNYNFAYSDITLDMTRLDLMRADSQVRPFTQIGPEGTKYANVETDIGGTGEREDLGPQAEWVLQGITKWSPNGRRKIFENNRYWAGAHYNDYRRLTGSPSAGELGLPPRADGGTEYRSNIAFSGTTIARPAVNWSPFDGDNGHHPMTSAIPFLLTGELMHLEELQGIEYRATHVSADATYQGSGINKTCFGDASETMRGDSPWGASLQQRAQGYLLRDLTFAYICTPDNANDKLYHPKTYYATKKDNTWSRAAFVQTTYTNGNAGAEEDYYDTDGPRYVGRRFNGNIDFGPWQANQVNLNMEAAFELGVISADTESFLDWFSVGIVNQVDNADIPADWYVPGYFISRKTPDDVAVQNWADTWRAWCCTELSQERTPFHRTPASITLSATSGAAVDVTLSGSPLGQTSWYAPSGSFLGMWVYEASGGSGRGRIVSVSDANTCVIDTTVTGGAAFSSTTPTASNCRIPPPHPLDAPTQGSYKAFTTDTAYPMIFRASCAVTANRAGYAVLAQAGIDYVDNHDFYANFDWAIRYNIEPRA